MLGKEKKKSLSLEATLLQSALSAIGWSTRRAPETFYISVEKALLSLHLSAVLNRKPMDRPGKMTSRLHKSRSCRAGSSILQHHLRFWVVLSNETEEYWNFWMFLQNRVTLNDCLFISIYIKGKTDGSSDKRKRCVRTTELFRKTHYFMTVKFTNK